MERYQHLWNIDDGFMYWRFSSFGIGLHVLLFDKEAVVLTVLDYVDRNWDYDE